MWTNLLKEDIVSAQELQTAWEEGTEDYVNFTKGDAEVTIECDRDFPLESEHFEVFASVLSGREKNSKRFPTSTGFVIWHGGSQFSVRVRGQQPVQQNVTVKLDSLVTVFGWDATKYQTQIAKRLFAQLEGYYRRNVGITEPDFKALSMLDGVLRQQNTRVIKNLGFGLSFQGTSFLTNEWACTISNWIPKDEYPYTIQTVYLTPHNRREPSPICIKFDPTREQPFYDHVATLVLLCNSGDAIGSGISALEFGDELVDEGLSWKAPLLTADYEPQIERFRQDNPELEIPEEILNKWR